MQQKFHILQQKKHPEVLLMCVEQFVYLRSIDTLQYSYIGFVISAGNS